MFALKKFLNKNLIQTPLQPFCNGKTTNLFQLDPIFPDFSEAGSYKRPTRMTFQEMEQKDKELRQTFYNKVLRKANHVMSEKQKALQRRKTKGGRKETHFEREAESFMNRIIVDPDFQLPYGFGFDAFIVELKEKRLSNKNNAFLYNLKNLFIDLDYTDDLQLLEYSKEAIVKKASKDYKERAKGVLVYHLLEQIKEKRRDPNYKPKSLDKVFENPEIAEAILNDNSDLNDDFKQKLSESISEQSVNNFAGKIADRVFDVKLKENKRIRYAEHEDYEPHEEYRFNDPYYNTETSAESDYEDHRFEELMPWAPKDKELEVSEDRMKYYYAKREMKKKYFRWKVNTEHKWHPNDNEYDIKGARQAKPFFEQFNGTDELSQLDYKTGLRQKEKPLFDEVFSCIDDYLIGAPVKLKATISHAHREEFDINQISGKMALNPNDFFWGQIDQTIIPVLPDKYDDSPYNMTKEFEMFSTNRLPDDSEQRQSLIEYDENGQEIDQTENATPQSLLDGDEDSIKDANPFIAKKKMDEALKYTTFDTSELTTTLDRQIEIFRQVRREPFFQHYINNHLRYYSDRTNSAMLSTLFGNNEATNHGDFYNHKLPEDAKGMYDKSTKNTDPKLYNGRAYGKGHRKTCDAFAIIQEGSGKITINKKPFLDYFTQSSHRNLIIKPLMLTRIGVEVNVELILEGGGQTGQAQAGRLAIAKALANWNPQFKTLLKKYGFLALDTRKKERKKTGLYAARTKYPYKRR